MIDLAPVIARLKAAGFDRIDGVTALARIDDAAPNFFPHLFVLEESERGEAPARVVRENPGLVDQSIQSTVAVIGLFGKASASPAAADAELREYADRIEKALMGWVHPGDSHRRATEFVSSRLMGLSGGIVRWGVSFRMWRRVRGASQ